MNNVFAGQCAKSTASFVSSVRHASPPRAAKLGCEAFGLGSRDDSAGQVVEGVADEALAGAGTEDDVEFGGVHAGEGGWEESGGLFATAAAKVRSNNRQKLVA